eukprot:m.132122 g.132122  ORF g.132122 m.132122 type:complete len:674 (+) comp13085_c0_seq7:4596-6617(+)
MSSNLRDREIGPLCDQLKQKLLLDEKKLKFFNEQVSKTSTTLKKMDGVLSDFLLRLDHLRTSVDPIHNDTFLMTRTQVNVNSAMDKLGQMSSFYECSSAANSIFGTTLSLDTVNDHLDMLTRVNGAIEYFYNNNPNNPELHKLTALRQEEENKLVNLYSERLEECSKPLELDFVGEIVEEQRAFIADGMESYKVPPCETQLEENKATLLKTICEWMIIKKNMKTECVNATTRIRKQNIEVMNGGIYFSRMHHSRHTTQVQGKGRVQKKGMLRRLSTRRQNHFDGMLGLGDGDVVGGDSHALSPMMTMDRSLAILRHEYAFLKKFLPRRESAAVLAKLVELILEPLTRSLLTLQSTIKKNIEDKHHYTALPLFSILNRAHDLAPHFLNVINMCENNTLRQHFNMKLLSLANLGKNLLNDFHESISMDPQQNKLPEDGTVHEMTSSSLKFFAELLQHVDSGGCVLQQEVGRPSTGLTWQSHDVATASLSHWISTAVTALLNNLELKSKCSLFQEKITQSVFLLNNYNYIKDSFEDELFTKTMKGSELEKLKQELQGLVDAAMEAYLDVTWVDVETALVLLNVSEPMTKRERELIKASYSKFNEEFNRVMAVHDNISIPSSALRQRVCDANVSVIVNKFKEFDETYKHTGFSQKNPHKYLKYDHVKVEMMIKSAFL